MMTNITIVTAFYDIGRGDWSTTVEKNGGPLPHYLQRSTQKYLEHFKRMGQMGNDIVAFTSPDLVDVLKDAVPKAKVIGYDYFTYHDTLRKQIESVQTNQEFVRKINPYQVRNPEYWSKDYVGVTSLKAYFVNQAFLRGLIKTELASWVDFGYCRDEDHIPVNGVWDFDFNKEKIHFFNYREPDMKDPSMSITDAVLNNNVYIIGGVFVAAADNWNTLSNWMERSLQLLISQNFVDDDQGLLLMAYYQNPNLFQLHNMPLDAPLEDVRSILRKYNKV